MGNELKLGEKLFCLAVHPQKGGILMGSYSTLSVVLSACVFNDLLKNKLVTFQNERIHLLAPEFQNDEILDFYILSIRLRENDRKLRWWLRWSNNRRRKIKKLFIRSLVRKNVLRLEERRFLFVPYTKVFVMNRALVQNIRNEVVDTLLHKTVASDEMFTLAVMAGKMNLMTSLFPDRQTRREALIFLKNVPETPVLKALNEAIRMMQAAGMAGVS